MGITVCKGPLHVGLVPECGNVVLSDHLTLAEKSVSAVLLYGSAACGKSTVATKLPNVVSSDRVRKFHNLPAGDNSIWPLVHDACAWLLANYRFFVLDATNLGPKQTADMVCALGLKDFTYIVPEAVLFHKTLTALRSLRGDSEAEYYSRTERFMRTSAPKALSQAAAVYTADADGELWEVSAAGLAGSICETSSVDEFEAIVRWCYKDPAGRLAKPFGWPQ